MISERLLAEFARPRVKASNRRGKRGREAGDRECRKLGSIQLSMKSLLGCALKGRARNYKGGSAELPSELPDFMSLFFQGHVDPVLAPNSAGEQVYRVKEAGPAMRQTISHRDDSVPGEAIYSGEYFA